jgi:hypothetical protein
VQGSYNFAQSQDWSWRTEVVMMPKNIIAVVGLLGFFSELVSPKQLKHGV